MESFEIKGLADFRNSSPWPHSAINEIKFPFAIFERLIDELGWEYADWLEYWLVNDGENFAANHWSIGTKKDWIWGLGLPILSDINRSFFLDNDRRILGISALPGCGKSSLGRWLEASAKQLRLNVNVLSLDDFYLPGEQLEKALLGNPWNVPRGLPGSHEISLLEDTLGKWLETGHLHAPKFDKALRNGSGDRSGWISSRPRVLILEGWFLGCNPISMNKMPIDPLHPGLTCQEVDYRRKVQNKLKEYSSTWSFIERLWHIKPQDFLSTCQWKVEQENRMLQQRGSSLQGESLQSFVRMIKSSIPWHSLNNIDSDVTVEVNTLRQILWSGRSIDYK